MIYIAEHISNNITDLNAVASLEVVPSSFVFSGMWKNLKFSQL